MEEKKLEPKLIIPHKKERILINDEGIGSNRIQMSNHYLNNFNYFHKNLIKMNKIREMKIVERKQNLDKFRKDKEIPGLMFSNAYYKYHGKDFFEDNKINIYFKTAKINYLQDLFDNENIIQLKSNNNKNKNNLRYSENLNNNYSKDKLIHFQNYKINNYKQKNLTLNNDDFNDLKNGNIRNKIMLAKTSNNYYDIKIKIKNKRYYSYNKNKDDDYVHKSTKNKFLNKNKLLPLIK